MVLTMPTVVAYDVGMTTTAAETGTKFNVRTAHGTIHTMTVGEFGRAIPSNADGKLYRRANRIDQAPGRADCGTLTSMAARCTAEAVTCSKCMERNS